MGEALGWVLAIAILLLTAAQWVYVATLWRDTDETHRELAEMKRQRATFLELMKTERAERAEIAEVVRRIERWIEAHEG